jgi:Fusaric acid resistance protein family
VSLAQIGGIVVTIGTVRLLRSVDAAWSARRILRSAWRDLAALAGSQRPIDELIWTERMLDRIALVTPRLALAACRT